MNKDYKYRIIGTMIQNGVDYLSDFNPHATEFYNKWIEVKTEIREYGFSKNWNNWLEENKEKNISLYEELKTAGLI